MGGHVHGHLCISFPWECAIHDFLPKKDNELHVCFRVPGANGTTTGATPLDVNSLVSLFGALGGGFPTPIPEGWMWFMNLLGPHNFF